MSRDPLPEATPAIRQQRRAAAPEIEQAWRRFSQAVFAPGALSSKDKQLIAVAVAHVTQCPYCIRGHVLAAHRQGATDSEVMEAIWVAAEMRAGAAFAHSTLALHELSRCRAHASDIAPTIEEPEPATPERGRTTAAEPARIDTTEGVEGRKVD